MLSHGVDQHASVCERSRGVISEAAAECVVPAGSTCRDLVVCPLAVSQIEPFANLSRQHSARTTAHLLSAATRASQKARMTDRSCSSTLLSSSFLQNNAGRHHKVMLWKMMR